jgi:rare lipoprotein A
MASSQGYVARGMASWYGTKFHGRRTSSGEPYDMYAMTAAHKHLPLPTYAQVVNLENGRSTVVRINDRGPFHDDRLIDLSYAAASKLGVLGNGTAMVEIRAIDSRADHTPGQIGLSPTQAATGERGLARTPNPTKVFLQAGAFSSQTNAMRFRDRLAESLAREVRVHSSEDGSGLHRVQIGPLASREQADTVASQLQRMGLANTQVIVD